MKRTVRRASLKTLHAEPLNSQIAVTKPDVEDRLDTCIYFCVDPELVEQVQLYVDSEDGGRSHQSQRQVVDLEEGAWGWGWGGETGSWRSQFQISKNTLWNSSRWKNLLPPSPLINVRPPYPGGELLGEGLPQGRGQVVVL